MIFTHRQRLRSETWENFESALASECAKVRETRAATFAATAKVRAELEDAAQRLACASSGAVQLTGVGGLRAEAREATGSYMEISSRESAQFKVECLEFKKTLKASVRGMVPILDPRTGRILPQKKNGAIAQWK
jgi:hypothetical protein